MQTDRWPRLQGLFDSRQLAEEAFQRIHVFHDFQKVFGYKRWA